jgi:hypothetical protein
MNRLTLISTVLLLMVSCSYEPSLELTPNEKILFDSLHRVEFANIRMETDSICKILEDSLYNYYVDSLLEVRLQEVEYLIKGQ